MEFWAGEVQSGKPLTCDPGTQRYIHISQAAIGDSKSGKGNERVVLKVKAGDSEAVVGTLSHGKCDQIPLDLIFDKPFVLSHNSSSSSVYFCGYKSETDNVTDESDDSDEDHTSDEDSRSPLRAFMKESGKLKGGKPEIVDTKPSKAPPGEKEETSGVPGKQLPSKKKLESAKKEDKEDEGDDEDDDDEEESDDLDDLEDDDMLDVNDDDFGSEESDSGDDDSEEDEQPKSAGKKRPLPGIKNAGAEKKAKVSTPKDKESGKHGNEGVAEYWQSLIALGQSGKGKAPLTPKSTPKAQQQQGSKKEASAKKTPAKENGVKAETPSSGKKGQFLCQPCSKNFQSEAALAMHNSAKHK